MQLGMSTAKKNVINCRENRTNSKMWYFKHLFNCHSLQLQHPSFSAEVHPSLVPVSF